MKNPSEKQETTTSRRDFLELGTGALAGLTLAGPLGARAGAGDDEIPVALVGCGGRGTGAAANALMTKGPVRLVAVADVFPDHMERAITGLTPQFGERMDVPPARRFAGFEGYRQAIDAVAPGGVVCLATPPAFRPLHLEYAVEKGCHVFMEKSFAVDAPGIRRVLTAGEKAQAKGLKVAGGLMSRHYDSLAGAIEKVHEGAIGELVTCWAYRVHDKVGYAPRRDGETEMAHQIRNYSCFTWLNGSFLLDWLIHNLDVCCWAKDAWPVSAQGQGGREVRTERDQLFDHYAVEYTFPDGTRLFAQGRHMSHCWGFFGDVLHGTKGCAVLGEGIPEPKLYSGFHPDREKLIWEHDGPGANPYQVEHDRLFAAIREDRPHNETERCAHAAMVGILGRMAVESGKVVTWDEAMASDLVLAPGLEGFTMDSAPPVVPDDQGAYPTAIPGVTKTV
jgi:predicted dehydrogenase